MDMSYDRSNFEARNFQQKIILEHLPLEYVLICAQLCMRNRDRFDIITRVYWQVWTREMLEPDEGEFPSAKAAGVWLRPYKQPLHKLEAVYGTSGLISADFKCLTTTAVPEHVPEYEDCLLYVPLLAADSDGKKTPGSVVAILKDYKVNRSRLSGEQGQRPDQEKLAIFSQFFQVSTNDHGPVCDRVGRQTRRKKRKSSEPVPTVPHDIDPTASAVGKSDSRRARQVKRRKRIEPSTQNRQREQVLNPDATHGSKRKRPKQSGKGSVEDRSETIAIVARSATKKQC
eukprot:g60759.t1